MARLLEGKKVSFGSIENNKAPTSNIKVNYVDPMIKNYLNCPTCDDLECSKIKIWTAPYKRTKLLFSDNLYSYIIILERNKNDMYIIISYLIDEHGYL